MKTLILSTLFLLVFGLGYLVLAKYALVPNPLYKSPPEKQEVGEDLPTTVAESESEVIGNILDEDILERTEAAIGKPPSQYENGLNLQMPPSLQGTQSGELAPPKTQDTDPSQTQTSVTVGTGLAISSPDLEAEPMQTIVLPDQPQETGEQTLPTTPKATPEPRPKVIDPREASKLVEETNISEWDALSEEEKMAYEHEPTNIFVQRTFLATLPDGETEVIRTKVPVVYKTRSLRITEKDRKEIEALIERSRKLQKTLKDAKEEAANILQSWNQIVRNSTPRTALLPESPSLPENQGGELNRTGENPDLLPGQPARLEIKN